MAKRLRSFLGKVHESSQSIARCIIFDEFELVLLGFDKLCQDGLFLTQPGFWHVE